MLGELRHAYEILVDRQKTIWARNRKPGDPPGGGWETSRQPRLHLHYEPNLVDEQTAIVVDFWIRGNPQDISSQLMGVPDAGFTEMMFMCSPVRDHGPAHWHRDLNPLLTAPLVGYVGDLRENRSPMYVQWNITLYDDKVLWVVPASHCRLNTDEEDRALKADLRRPLPNSMPVELGAGDGVVYILPILHWGSNYSTKLRRVIHGGYSNYNLYENPRYMKHVSEDARTKFDGWLRRSEEMQDLTESILRAVINRDGVAYHAGLEAIRPGCRENGKALLTVYLCKAVIYMSILKGNESDAWPDSLQSNAERMHPITLNWGPKFAHRFSKEEVDVLWNRFKIVNQGLRSDQEGLVPGFQTGPLNYHFNEMPPAAQVDTFIASW